jgi:hypothetical protein
MSAESDFALTDWVFQASGTQVSWEVSWPGVLDDSRFAAVSFQGDFVDSTLIRVSEAAASHPAVALRSSSSGAWPAARPRLTPRAALSRPACGSPSC